MRGATAEEEITTTVRAREMELSGRRASGHLHFDRSLRAWRTHEEMVEAGLVDDREPATLEGDVT